MLITLISMLLSVLGFIGFYLFENIGYQVFSFLIAILGVIAFASSIILILIVNVGKKNELNKMQNRRDVLVYKLEEDEVNYSLLSEEINEFNDKVLDAKYFKDNLWINWFHNTLLADLEVIDIRK